MPVTFARGGDEPPSEPRPAKVASKRSPIEEQRDANTGWIGEQGISRPEEGPGLQDRLGGRPFRAAGDVPREPEPRRVGRPPGAAGVLSGPPRRAAGARGGGGGRA